MATWQAAEPGTVIGDGKGNYQMRVAGQWLPMPKGSLAADEHGAYHFDSDVMKPPEAPTTTDDVAPAPTTTGDVVKGVGDAALSGVSKVAGGIVGAPISLANRLIAAFSGGDPRIAADAAHEYINRNFGHDTQTPVGRQIGAAVQQLLAPLGESAHNIEQLLESGGEKIGIPKADTQNMTGEAGDILGTAGVVAPVLAGARASTEAAELAAQNAPPAVAKYGLRTGADSPIARNVAGASAKPTVAAANQARVDPVLGAQAGVPPGTKITPAALEAARGPADSVYQRAEQSIPTSPLSPAAAQTVQGVGADDMIVHSPDTQATIDAQKARLLSGPLTGSEVVNGQRALRFNGFRNVASEDPEQSALGQAQLKMADALHQHMVDTLPPDAPVSADQLAAARVALAQNHTIESVLGPNGNVNLTKLAKIHNDNPGMLSGPMADIAQFASDHPEVTRLPSDAERFNPSGFIKDVASVNPLERPVGSVAQLFGGTLARRTLRGPKPTVSPSVTGLGGEFGPLDRGAPQPPPGMTASTPTAPAPSATGPPGQISLADLLSHGVEQPAPQGLSVGQAPAPQGIPFTQNAEHMAGGLELAPERTYGGQPANNSDLGAVMSQGVPEGIVQRSKPSGLTMPVAHNPAFITNNASGESAASQEAINRTASEAPRFIIDPDGNVTPLKAEGAAVADYKPSQGSIVVQGGGPNGRPTIIDRGGLPQSHANGLLNRALSRKLGDEF